jgi:hypothetical protein
MGSVLRRLALPPALIYTIINDPSLLASPSTLEISSSTVSIILEEGYTRGFRTLFILNASLGVIATIISITMIKHKDLARGDEEELKRQGKELATANISTPSSPTKVNIQKSY